MLPCIEKYLKTWAEPEAVLALQCVKSSYGSVLTVPAFSESEGVLTQLEGLLQQATSPVLIVLLVNAPGNASVQDIQLNHHLMLSASSRYAVLEKLFPMTLYDYGQHGICVIDRTTNPLPTKLGVGLARKIAGDVALTLYARGRVRSPWMHVSDADVIFPKNYFVRIPDVKKTSVCLYPFIHRGESDVQLKQAIKDYDAYLQSYVDGLQFAGSPYAFHTIGSTLAIHMDAYAKVRGFPKRAAGEDFYVLNKLAKVGRVHALSGEPLILSGRLSHRVPFGTGDAMTKITQAGKSYDPYVIDCFKPLRDWLMIIENLNLSVTAQTLKQALSDQGGPASLAALESMGVFLVLDKALANVTTDEQLVRYFHTWFDGFKTLKFVRCFYPRKIS